MKKMRVEDKYTDILQNIEFAIVLTYNNYPEMSDYDVMRMLEALIDRYVGEKIGRSPRNTPLSETERTLIENVRRMCEWRLGRAALTEELEEATEIKPNPVTVDEIVLCLKRILKSVKRWNKDGGRRGYLDFIVEYLE